MKINNYFKVNSLIADKNKIPEVLKLSILLTIVVILFVCFEVFCNSYGLGFAGSNKANILNPITLNNVDASASLDASQNTDASDSNKKDISNNDIDQSSKLILNDQSSTGLNADSDYFIDFNSTVPFSVAAPA